ncbi:hypothetical protein [Amycolatopsis sp. NPDC051128]|uniref:hypothetical protein n=1 Tax=Amycolatopsis sp. NPDC051128 TaxID=3155412 RepID=UPI0034448D12
MAREFATRWGYRPRQAWRHAHGWTQDEAAGHYNRVLGSPRAPMSGKRICDYEAWPNGGVKPTHKTLSILAQLYDTEPCTLLDFTDFQAMTPEERISLRYLHSARDNNAGLAISQTENDIADPGGILELISGEYLRCVQCHLETVTSGTFRQREIEDLLVSLAALIKKLGCTHLGWLDVMIPVQPEETKSSRRLIDGVTYDGGLQVLFSSTRRTGPPTIIPIKVNNTPWRGSANAFISCGLDYISSFQGLYEGPEYNLPPRVLKEVEQRYDYWREECSFASLLAIAVLTPEEDPARAVGVLNLNFEQECPFGDRKELAPKQSIALLNLLDPTLQILASAIRRHNDRKCVLR